MKQPKEESTMKVDITHEGVRIEIIGNPDDISHGIAEAMIREERMEELIRHAVATFFNENTGKIRDFAEKFNDERVEPTPKIKKKRLN